MWVAWMLGAARAGGWDPAVRLPADPRPTAYAVELHVDPRQESFSGAETVDVTLDRPARSLVLHAAGLEIGSASVAGADGAEHPATVTAGEQTVELAWEPKLRGPVRVRLAWQGKASDLETQGLFRQQEGDDWYLFSQFEATDARRAFPCFDQPEFKVPWTLTLEVPEADRAYANAPVDREEALGDGTRRVTFAATAPLPSYLVAFAVGPFDEIDAGTAGQNHVPLRVVVPRGRADWAGYAVSTVGPTLDWLERYFGIPYPYAKLDIVSLPQAVGWGAMENAGMITVVQGYVIARPEDDTLARHRAWRLVLAHEMAHQWFGDLVTPRWWEDLWLNESFASWMEGKVLAELEPSWEVEVDRVEARSSAMAADALTTARAVRHPARTFDDIEGSFDAITYDKGRSVLAMVEGWLGAEVFQRGVHDYLVAHANGTATAEDFGDALSAAAGRDLAHVLSTFLDRPGTPLLSATLQCGDGPPRLALRQERWLPAGSSGRANQRWDLPVCVRYDADGVPMRRCMLLVRGSAELPLDPAKACPAWVQPNDLETGYYRVSYEGEMLPQLLASGALSVPEKVGVLDAASAAVEAGSLSPTVLLGEVPALVARGDPQGVEATTHIVAALDQQLITDEVRPDYQRFVRDTYGSAAARLGWTSAPSDTDAIRRERAAVLMLVGTEGEDQTVLADARTRADQWLTDRTGIDPDVIGVALVLAAHGGDRALYDRMRAQAAAETDRDRRELLYDALGAFRSPDALDQALHASLDPTIDLREAFGLLVHPLSDPVTRPAAWAFVQQNTDALAERIPAIARSYLVLSGGGWCDAARRAEVDALFAERSRRWVNGRHQLEQVMERIDVCAATVDARRAEVARFLASTPSVSPGNSGP